MNQLQRVFNYRGNGVRTVINDGEPWFAVKDICEYFGDKHYRRSVGRLDDDEKGVTPFDTPGGIQHMTVVNEPGLYNLLFIMQPQKKEHMTKEKYEARVNGIKEFKRWVTHDVLPAIRRHGSYSIQIPQTYPEALRLAADLAEENQRLLPKAEMHDLFLSADNCQSMNEVAKSLGTGRTRLFQFLRDKKILMTNNTPYQEYLHRGYFRVVEKPIVMGDQAINKPQTFVTAKGVDFIAKLKREEVPYDDPREHFARPRPGVGD